MRKTDFITRDQSSFYRFIKLLIMGPICSIIDIFVKFRCITGITIFTNVIDIEKYNEFNPNNIKYNIDQNNDNIGNNHYGVV